MGVPRTMMIKFLGSAASKTGFFKLGSRDPLMLLLAVSADISPQDQSGLWRCAAGPGPGGVWVAGRIPFSPVHLGGGQGCQIFLLYIKDEL